MQFVCVALLFEVFCAATNNMTGSKEFLASKCFVGLPIVVFATIESPFVIFCSTCQMASKRFYSLCQLRYAITNGWFLALISGNILFTFSLHM